MKAIFMTALLLAVSNAQAIENSAHPSQEARIWTVADPIPVGKGLTLTDAKGCAWSVVEDNQGLKVFRPQDPSGQPLCVKDIPTKNGLSEALKGL
ncbi:hypothetical protein [Pseudomonas frederiksbergensis]|uniref:hypothetical protein n=1 Tax=Pseudomonas frederiksbergensis TaxID=104087 RepID=UPI0028643F86|nr:hypothetical protein [Pseudomonas frederiksbergensis]MDR7108901.1 hypothetical protein [Pseudomonas frederiksbergensis]